MSNKNSKNKKNCILQTNQMNDVRLSWNLIANGNFAVVLHALQCCRLILFFCFHGPPLEGTWVALFYLLNFLPKEARENTMLLQNYLIVSPAYFAVRYLQATTLNDNWWFTACASQAVHASNRYSITSSEAVIEIIHVQDTFQCLVG